MRIGAVRDNRIPGYRCIAGDVPKVEAVALRDIHDLESAIIRHGPPTERQILGNETGQSIEVVALDTEYPCGDPVMGAHLERPSIGAKAIPVRDVDLQGLAGS